MPRSENLIGQKFGKLTVIANSNQHGKGQRWICKCDCGNIKENPVQCYKLKAGIVVSCGCTHSKHLKEFGKLWYKHGQTGSKVYWVWSSMKERCINKNNKFYFNYGGRGIKVCDEWLDFITFYQWAIGRGYKQGLTIERINNNKNYEPNNCKWTTRAEQQNNKRSNRLITRNNQTKTVAQWSRKLGIGASTLYSRLNRGNPAKYLLAFPSAENKKLFKSGR